MGDVPTVMLEQITELINICLPIIYAAVAALSISALMSLYDSQPLRKTVIGSLVCGVVTLVMAGSLEYLSLPSSAIIFIGASVGFMGADKLRKKFTGVFGKKNGRAKGKNE